MRIKNRLTLQIIKQNPIIGVGTGDFPTEYRKINQIKVYNNYKMAVHKSHAIAVLTEWDEFVNYDWDTIYKNMYKPAFIFDGRNILNNEKLTNIGFKVRSIGK